jgi:NTE family protein
MDATKNAGPLDHLVARYGYAYPADRLIVRQGDHTTDLFVVLRGAVEFRGRDDGGIDHWLGVGGAGTIFGEIAAFTGVPRTANVAALLDTVVLKLPREAANEMLEASPPFARQVVQTLARRLRARPVA